MKEIIDFVKTVSLREWIRAAYEISMLVVALILIFITIGVLGCFNI
jgi:hypothetical protein